jgi:3-phosphoglycerate kinase
MNGDYITSSCAIFKSMTLKTINPQSINNKKIIVRVDYNVPLEKNSSGELEVGEDRRIRDSLPTIKLLLDQGAQQIILMSHLGRPGGEVKPELSLQPVAKYLSQLLEKEKIGNFEVPLVENYDQVTDQPIILLENLRFNPGEKKNDTEFAQQLADLADIYINDAFSASHRAHASVSKISELLPSFAGLALTKEVEMLSKLMEKPKRPFVVIVGGAKISDKVTAIEHLAKIADTVLVGGGVANNFLKAEGFPVYNSYLEDKPADLSKKDQNFVDFAQHLLQDHQQENTLVDDFLPLPKIIYPIDVLTGHNFEDETPIYHQIIKDGSGKKDAANQPSEKQLQKEMFLDIGPKTIKLFESVIKQAGTIFWNGPMGVFENSEFSMGTKKIAKAISKSDGESILGGGDTIAAINHFQLAGKDKFDYVSAAGGASLEFLSGRELPGLKKLLK